MKAMICYPLTKDPSSEVWGNLLDASIYLEEKGVDTEEMYSSIPCDEELREQDVKNAGPYILAKKLERMSKCDFVYCCNGWEQFRSSRMLHEIAKAYGLKIEYQS